MKRGKKIVLLCHCILNSNAKVKGLSEYSSIIKEIVDLLEKKEIGIVQLPCPEMLVYGCNRWGHVREQFDNPYFRKKCRDMMTYIIYQLIDYTKNGNEIVGLIGIDGSPSCGVNKTCSSSAWGGEFLDNDEIEDKIKSLKFTAESGVFIEEIKKMFEANDLNIPLIAIDEMKIYESIDSIETFLSK